MDERRIREKYQRDGGSMGANQKAIDRFIQMLHCHEKCDNEYIRNIVKNIHKFEEIAPNFTIFESPNRTFFLKNFNAIQIIDEGSGNDLVLSHEFGHAILEILNNTEIPEDFENIVKGARAHCVNAEKKDEFIEYIEYLSDVNEINRTEAEKGPVSDIISSIFQYPSLHFLKTGKTCVLPVYHDREEYFDEKKGKMRVGRILEEDFANFYALVANNCHRELEILKNLLGEEWFQVMENELSKASRNIEKEEQITEQDVMDLVKDSIRDVRKSQIPDTIIYKENIKEEGEKSIDDK